MLLRTIYILLCFLFYLTFDKCGDNSILIESPCKEIYTLLERLTIESVSIPQPVLLNSTLEVRGDGFIEAPQCSRHFYKLVGRINGREVDVEVTPEIVSIDKVNIKIDREIVNQIGYGHFSGLLQVTYISIENGSTFVFNYPLSFDLERYITPSVSSVDQGEHFINDLIIVRGSNFVMKDEGDIKFIIDGRFMSREGGEDIEVHNLEIYGIKNQGENRNINGFLLSPKLCNLQVGEFLGTIILCNFFPDGTELCSDTVEISFEIKESYILGFEPETFSIGQIVDIIGKGFVGGEDGITTIRLTGYITKSDGLRVPIDKEIVPQFVSGDTLKYTVTVTNDNISPISEDFGVNSGDFDGTATLILMYKNYQKEIGPIDFFFSIAPVKQVIWIRFLDDFNDTLELFGLRALSNEIKQKVFEKVTRVYEGINVEFRSSQPLDFYPGGYSIVDVGGRDPNGLGLFGYDNTPGKDVNNLRLHDRIGGVNAITQEDGAPGYGGVFIESFLFFSSHPELGYLPPQRPQPDPLFDEVFDPVRYNKVKAGEYPNGSDPSRIVQIERAFVALANMIGDTIAHEIGHSLGLANPQYPEGYYHRLFPQDGCLMDSGDERPLEERAELNGNQGGYFCGEEVDYLKRILPVE